MSIQTCKHIMYRPVPITASLDAEQIIMLRKDSVGNWWPLSFYKKNAFHVYFLTYDMYKIQYQCWTIIKIPDLCSLNKNCQKNGILISFILFKQPFLCMKACVFFNKYDYAIIVCLQKVLYIISMKNHFRIVLDHETYFKSQSELTLKF